jgi:hypothetical protein
MTRRTALHARRASTPCAALLGLLVIGAAGCPDDPHGSGGSGGSGGEPVGPPAWQTVYDGTELGGALLSVWGSGPSDVYAVGGPLGNDGFEAVAIHYDGSSWEQLDPGGADSFWWVGGSGADDVWMVGEKGRITHWDGASFEEHLRPTTATLWGVWAASPDDAWAVGGTPEGGTAAPNDLVLHWDGSAWSQETLPGAPLGRSLYKVWGTSSEDLYVVGEAGTVWHREGSTWTLESEPPIATSTLFTVYGCGAGDVYAVGGSSVLHSEGAAWTAVDVALTNQVNGVTCGAPGEVLIVGFGGLKQRLVDGTWIDEFAQEPYADMHATWADGQGTFWTVGGDFLSHATAGKARKAVLGRYGKGTVASPTF